MRLLYILIFCLLICSNHVFAQADFQVKYYDSSWNEASKGSAFYFTEYIKLDSVYKATSYWMNPKKLHSISFYRDTSFKENTGFSLKYYEDGNIEDSSVYSANQQIVYSDHYYPDGKIWVHYVYDEENEKEITNAYNQDGSSIKEFIYFREAAFPGGDAEWKNHIAENIKADIPVKKGAPVGTYKVVIRFIVDLKGKITEIQPETDFGFGMEAEGIRVIKKSPKWNPAIWLNKPVKAYRRQPLTFVVSE